MNHDPFGMIESDGHLQPHENNPFVAEELDRLQKDLEICESEFDDLKIFMEDKRFLRFDLQFDLLNSYQRRLDGIKDEIRDLGGDVA